MASKKLDGFVQPVPMRMTPSSMAARNVEMLQVLFCSNLKIINTKLKPLDKLSLDSPAEGTIESKRKMYLELDFRHPGADESSSAQV